MAALNMRQNLSSIQSQTINKIRPGGKTVAIGLQLGVVPNIVFFRQDEAMDVILNTADRFLWDCSRISHAVKQQLDERLGSSWHVITGEAFGYEVTFEGRSLISVLYGSLAIVAW